MIVSIGGIPGSGKSTIAKMLAEKLGYEYVYMGGLRREIAQKRGMTIQELNSLGEKEDWTDREVDATLTVMGRTKDNLVIDSRVAYHFVPQSLKVFVTVDSQVAAERIFKSLGKDSARKNEGTHLTSVESVLASDMKRAASDRVRYQRYYQTDCLDSKNYDLVLDTTTMDIPASFHALYAFVQSHLKSRQK